MKRWAISRAVVAIVALAVGACAVPFDSPVSKVPKGIKRSGAFIVFQFPPGYPEELRAFREAADRWSERTGDAVHYEFVEATRDTIFTLCMAHTVLFTGIHYESGGKTVLASASRCMDLAVITWRHTDMRDRPYCMKLQVAEHELGHTAGFDHVDAEPNLMFPESTCQNQWGKLDQAQCEKIGYCDPPSKQP
jgi:hypothetical protein